MTCFMSFSGRLVQEFFVADGAFKFNPLILKNLNAKVKFCYLFEMGFSMLFKISCCSESLSAFRTLEGLFTSVDFLVSFKV